jgi:hypothetical protein
MKAMRYLTGSLSVWMAFTAMPLRSQEMLNLIVVEGEGAINNIRQRTARETIVQVEDENRKPVAGAVVVFTLPSQGAGGTFANGAQMLTVTTNAQGRAVAQGLRVNRIAGQWQMRVNASLGNRTGSVIISQTNVVAAAGAAAGSGAAAGISGKTIAIIAAVAGAAAAGGAVAATRGGGGGGSSAAVPTTIAAGTGTVGHP